MQWKTDKIKWRLKWHKWFAWYPVTCRDGSSVWLEYVWRRWPDYARYDEAQPIYAVLADGTTPPKEAA